jgi:hypothetical protein
LHSFAENSSADRSKTPQAAVEGGNVLFDAGIVIIDGAVIINSGIVVGITDDGAVVIYEAVSTVLRRLQRDVRKRRRLETARHLHASPAQPNEAAGQKLFLAKGF